MVYEPINLDPQSEFFIALCSSRGHSYVTLGVKIAGQIRTLAAVGKRFADNHPALCDFLFTNTRAVIKNEEYVFEKKWLNLDYKAYAITLQNYFEFLDYLKSIVLNQGANMQAYFPEPDNPFIFKYQYVTKFALPDPSIFVTNIDQHTRISLNNTCRHSAINLTHEASKLTNLGNGVSSLFFKDLPLKAVFARGVFRDATPYFYILPIPPTALGIMPAAKLKIVTKLYQRLDEIALIEQKNPITILKFHRLKELYNNLTINQQNSMLMIMQKIDDWTKINQQLIETHRQSHWFTFQTATAKMFAQFRN